MHNVFFHFSKRNKQQILLKHETRKKITRHWEQYYLLLINEHLHSLLISCTKNSSHCAPSTPSGISKIHGWVFHIIRSLKCQWAQPASFASNILRKENTNIEIHTFFCCCDFRMKTNPNIVSNLVKYSAGY